jgi:hypothetical protein
VSPHARSASAPLDVFRSPDLRLRGGGCGPRAGQTASQTEAEMNSVVGRSAWPHVLGSSVTSGEEMV